MHCSPFGQLAGLDKNGEDGDCGQDFTGGELSRAETLEYEVGGWCFLVSS